MIRSVIPIGIKKGSFWASKEGIECIERFLSNCIAIPSIGQVVVSSTDKKILSLTERLGIAATDVSFPGDINLPYTFEQTLNFAKQFVSYQNIESDPLVIVDHRHLLLGPEDIEKAICLYQAQSEKCLISVSMCRDYPCQYVSFYKFLGNAILHFDKKNDAGFEKKIQVEFEPIKHSLCVCMKKSNVGIQLAFERQDSLLHDFVARVIPFGQEGLLFDREKEFLISRIEKIKTFDIEAQKYCGIVIFFFMPPFDGEYDTKEIFIPAKAPWKLSGEGRFLENEKTSEPMFGRQYFPKVYSYDGAISIFEPNAFGEDETFNPATLMIKNTGFVADRIDFLQVTTHGYKGKIISC